MMLLPQPEMCSLQLLDDVVAEKQGGADAAFFNGVAAEWKARVQAYIQHGGSPEQIPRWPVIEPQKERFLNLYSSKAKSVQKPVVKKMRDEHGLSYCPACGEPGSPYTLDHYLPKTLYSHFCVTPLNLFPMCDACQNKKGTKTCGKNGHRLFIHPYFDVFVAEQVIELTFQPPYDAPGFALKPREDLPPEHAQLVGSHMRELAMKERYLSYFKGQHRRLLRLVDDLRRSAQDVRASLVGFRNSSAIFGANVWDHVFYAAVLEDHAMMAYLENDPLPPYV